MRETVKLNEAEQLQLQKTQDGELKAAAASYKKRQQEAAREARQVAKEERERERKAKADRLAASRALKKQ